MSEIFLKPCPCCGEMAKMRPAEYPVKPYVFCTMCHTLGPSEYTEAKAAEAWNRRAGEDALRDENARLRKALGEIKTSGGMFGEMSPIIRIAYNALEVDE